MVGGPEDIDPQPNDAATADQKTAETSAYTYMEDRSKHYHQVNAGANRRQATRLRAPAITWHRAFWLAPPYTRDGIPNEEYLQYDRDYKKTIMDDIILLVWSFIYRKSQSKNSGVIDFECYPKVTREDNTQVYLLFASAIKPQIREGALSFDWIKEKELLRREKEIFTSDNRVVGLKFSLYLMEFTLRVELHSEYFTLTLYAEFPRFDKPNLIDELRNKLTENGHYDQPELMEQHLGVLKTTYDEIGNYFKTAGRSGAETLSDALFHKFWRQCFLKEFHDDTKLQEKLNDPIFEEVFADFRGIILCENNCPVILNTLGKDKELDWGKQIHEKCINLFSHHERYECTASYMLDGRAAYFTTLGPQFPEIPDKNLIPLEYVLFVNQEYRAGQVSGHVNRWQLGRLVDRIHLLGTARLASLLYLPSLRHAGETLSHLDSYINAAREAIDPSLEELNNSATQQDADDAGTTDGRVGISRRKEEDAFKHMKTAHRLFATITKEFNQETETNTGILYRIEQSRYYKEQFSKNVPALRLHRMEGFQKYDEFIERRLGTAFDFIDRLGRRYERATATITALDQNYLAMETNHIDGIIRVIQQWGEFFLLAALVPYYVVHLTAQIVQEQYMPPLTVGVWTALMCIAMYRISEGKRFLARFFFTGVPILVVVTAGAVLTFTGGPLWAGLFRFWGSSDEQLAVQRQALTVQKQALTAQNQTLTVQRDALGTEKNLPTLKDLQSQITQLSANQREELAVLSGLLEVQKHSEGMQTNAIQIFSELKSLLDARKTPPQQ